MADPDVPDADAPLPQPRTAPGGRSARRAAAEAAGRPLGPPGPTAPAPRAEPVVDIAPARWFATFARVAAAAIALLALVAGVGGLAGGDPIAAVVSLVAGLGVAVMAFDAGGRSARSGDGRLVVQQWFRTTVLDRDDVLEFSAARASFLRWDIVAVRQEGPQLRLWVTRMLPAGRRTRQGWLADLEAWRTWVSRSTPPG